ncbi:hypothetical protein ABEW19_28065 [Paenibacillus illinoisensis]
MSSTQFSTQEIPIVNKEKVIILQLDKVELKEYADAIAERVC